MIEVDTLEETLGGKWRGLYGEVVEQDCYRLQQVNSIPDVILDIGANVGTFARFARTLWPAARIYCLEPDPENATHLQKFTDDPRIFLKRAALGPGSTIYHGLTAINGSGATYLSAGIGYPKERLSTAPDMEPVEMETVMLDYFEQYISPGEKLLVKIDCEGAENCLWNHAPSMALLRRADYLAMEVHFYAATGAEWQEVQDVTRAALQSFESTHDCELDNVHFWATKKTIMINYRRDFWKLLPPRAHIAEIGVAEGNFSEVILKWPVTERLYLVDRWMQNPGQRGDGGSDQDWHDKNFNHVLRRTAPFGGKAVILRGDSVGMAKLIKPGTLDLVYIDADHSFEGCLRDLMAWTPLVKPGGIVALHDYCNQAYGVRRAVDTFTANSSYHVFMLPEDKMEDAGAYFLC